MSDPVVDPIQQVVDAVKARTKAAFKEAVVAVGSRVVYAGIGAVAMFVVLRLV